MIVVISSTEEMTTQELDVVEYMAELCLDVRFHLRKPQWSEQRVLNWVEKVKKLAPTVPFGIHNYVIDGCSLHVSENMRNRIFNKATSTSFHDEATALAEGKEFDYFFCSPVFESISKPGYQPKADWNLQNWPEYLKSKSVALGGIDKTLLTDVQNKGFGHIAICGAIWNAQHPVSELKTIIETCQEQDLFV